VFWTVALPDDAVRINPFAGTAEMHVRDLHLSDYFNIPNGLGEGPHDPATVSFDVSWGGPVTRNVLVRDTKFGFAGAYAWSGGNDTTGFRFRAIPGDFATTVALGGTPFAELGFERNGIFFQPDDSDRQGGDDGDAALVHALAGSPAAPAPTGLAPPPRPRGADPGAAASAGKDQPVQQPPVAERPAAPPAPTRALDQVFADPDGGAFSDPLRSIA
jgi:hypothetical protein